MVLLPQLYGKIVELLPPFQELMRRSITCANLTSLGIRLTQRRRSVWRKLSRCFLSVACLSYKWQLQGKLLHKPEVKAQFQWDAHTHVLRIHSSRHSTWPRRHTCRTLWKILRYLSWTAMNDYVVVSFHRNSLIMTLYVTSHLWLRGLNAF